MRFNIASAYCFRRTSREKKKEIQLSQKANRF